MPYTGLNARRSARDLLKADLLRAETGEFGLSDAEKAQYAQAQQEAASQQAGVLAQDAQRQAMARGPFAGQQQAAARQIANQAAEIGAGARAEVEGLSAKIAEARRRQLEARLAEERDRRRRTTGDVLTVAGSTAAGAGAGAAAGGIGAIPGAILGFGTGLAGVLAR